MEIPKENSAKVDQGNKRLKDHRSALKDYTNLGLLVEKSGGGGSPQKPLPSKASDTLGQTKSETNLTNKSHQDVILSASARPSENPIAENYSGHKTGSFSPNELHTLDHDGEEDEKFEDAQESKLSLTLLAADLDNFHLSTPRRISTSRSELHEFVNKKDFVAGLGSSNCSYESYEDNEVSFSHHSSFKRSISPVNEEVVDEKISQYFSNDNSRQSDYTEESHHEGECAEEDCNIALHLSSDSSDNGNEIAADSNGPVSEGSLTMQFQTIFNDTSTSQPESSLNMSRKSLKITDSSTNEGSTVSVENKLEAVIMSEHCSESNMESEQNTGFDTNEVSQIEHLCELQREVIMSEEGSVESDIQTSRTLVTDDNVAFVPEEKRKESDLQNAQITITDNNEGSVETTHNVQNSKISIKDDSVQVHPLYKVNCKSSAVLTNMSRNEISMDDNNEELNERSNLASNAVEHLIHSAEEKVFVTEDNKEPTETVDAQDSISETIESDLKIPIVMRETNKSKSTDQEYLLINSSMDANNIVESDFLDFNKITSLLSQYIESKESEPCEQTVSPNISMKTESLKINVSAESSPLPILDDMLPDCNAEKDSTDSKHENVENISKSLEEDSSILSSVTASAIIDELQTNHTNVVTGTAEVEVSSNIESSEQVLPESEISSKEPILVTPDLVGKEQKSIENPAPSDNVIEKEFCKNEVSAEILSLSTSDKSSNVCIKNYLGGLDNNEILENVEKSFSDGNATFSPGSPVQTLSGNLVICSNDYEDGSVHTDFHNNCMVIKSKKIEGNENKPIKQIVPLTTDCETELCKSNSSIENFSPPVETVDDKWPSQCIEKDLSGVNQGKHTTEGVSTIPQIEKSEINYSNVSCESGIKENELLKPVEEVRISSTVDANNCVHSECKELNLEKVSILKNIQDEEHEPIKKAVPSDNCNETISCKYDVSAESLTLHVVDDTLHSQIDKEHSADLGKNEKDDSVPKSALQDKNCPSLVNSQLGPLQIKAELPIPRGEILVCSHIDDKDNVPSNCQGSIKEIILDSQSIVDRTLEHIKEEVLPSDNNKIESHKIITTISSSPSANDKLPLEQTDKDLAGFGTCENILNVSKSMLERNNSLPAAVSSDLVEPQTNNLNTSNKIEHSVPAEEFKVSSMVDANDIVASNSQDFSSGKDSVSQHIEIAEHESTEKAVPSDKANKTQASEDNVSAESFSVPVVDDQLLSREHAEKGFDNVGKHDTVEAVSKTTLEGNNILPSVSSGLVQLETSRVIVPNVTPNNELQITSGDDMHCSSVDGNKIKQSECQDTNKRAFSESMNIIKGEEHTVSSCIQTESCEKSVNAESFSSSTQTVDKLPNECPENDMADHAKCDNDEIMLESLSNGNAISTQESNQIEQPQSKIATLPNTKNENECPIPPIKIKSCSDIEVKHLVCQPSSKETLLLSQEIEDKVSQNYRPTSSHDNNKDENMLHAEGALSLLHESNDLWHDISDQAIKLSELVESPNGNECSNKLPKEDKDKKMPETTKSLPKANKCVKSKIPPKRNLRKRFQMESPKNKPNSNESSLCEFFIAGEEKTDAVVNDFDEMLAEEAGNLSQHLLSLSQQMQDSDSENDNNKTVITVDNVSSRFAKASPSLPQRSTVSLISQSEELPRRPLGVLECAYLQSMHSVLPAHLNQSEAGPITADELSTQDLEFQDGASLDLDYFNQVGSKEDKLRSSLTRDSLYVKFDPIVNAIVSKTVSDSFKMPPPFTEQENTSEEQNEFKSSESNAEEQTDSPKTPGKSPALEAVQKLISLTPPPASSATTSPAKSDRSSLGTPTSIPPKSAFISQDQLKKELTKLENIMREREKYFEVELDKRLSELEKKDSELKATTSRRAEMDAELKAAAEREMRLKKEVVERTKSKQQLGLVMEEYEKTISQLVAQKEEDKKEFEVQKDLLMKERDTAMQHLNNMEIAFNDVHQKYERSKTVIEGMKVNEDSLKTGLAEYDDAIKTSNAKYESLKNHAIKQLETANKELDSIRRSHQAELAKMKAMLKKAEVRVTSLEESLEQKAKENQELAAICDELISKVGSGN